MLLDLVMTLTSNINDNALPVVESTRDLGVLVSCYLSPSLHVSYICALPTVIVLLH